MALALGLYAAGSLLRVGLLLRADRRRDPSPGAPLPVTAAPHLVATLAEVCRAGGRPLPAQVLLVPEANAYAGHASPVPGLRGHDVLVLGLGLVVVLDVPALRAVVAHELGHHEAGAVALSPWAYRARARLVEQAEQAGSVGILARLFRVYTDAFLRITAPLSRQQELDADALAAELVSPAHTAEALRRVTTDGALWNTYWHQDVVPLLDAGFVAPVVEGFAHFRQARARVGAPTTSPAPRRGWATHLDAHPPLPERLAALGDPPAPGPAEPALALVDDLGELERAAIQGVLGRGRVVHVVDEEGAPTDAAPPGPREVRLRRVAWADVGARVWVPRHAEEIRPWGRRLGPDTLLRVPELVADRQALGACLAARGPRLLSPEALHRRHLDLLVKALAVAMSAAGWRAEALPGGPLTLVRGEERVDPREAVLHARAGDWATRLGGWLAPQSCKPTDSVPP